MGVLQRFERRLEGMVEGTFARLFKGAVQPVEVAAALQREAADKKAIVGAGRVLVPNTYVVELGESDAERLAPYEQALRVELAGMVAEHAQEQGWSFVGPVEVRLEQVDGFNTGVFRVRSGVAEPSRARLPARRLTGGSAAERGGHPRLVLVMGGGTSPVGPNGTAGERVIPLDRGVLVIGRGVDADLTLPDPGVSRRHAEIRYDAGIATVVDLSSTNGTTVNGRKVATAQLQDGDHIGVGTSALTYRLDT